MRVCTLVGTRPEIIKLSRVIPRLDEFFDHQLVHTGQNFDHSLNDVIFDQLELRMPDAVLGAASGSPMGTIANVLTSFDAWLDQNPVDAVLVLGDTNSALGVLAAKRRRIPVFHMEAGNRCFDERVPEEINRRIVDHTSDINLAYTEHARRNLLAEGLPPDRVFVTGSPQREVIEHYRARIDSADVLQRLGLEPGRFFVASVHREENVDEEARLREVAETLNAVADEFGHPVVLSLHPRARRRAESLGVEFSAGIRPHEPFGFLDYMKLQIEAHCVLSDSGTITEESSILGFPAVNLREAHERPEGIDVGVLPMSGIGKPEVVAAIRLATSRIQQSGPAPSPADYEHAGVSWTVCSLISGYVSYVNHVVWRTS